MITFFQNYVDHYELHDQVTWPRTLAKCGSTCPKKSLWKSLFHLTPDNIFYLVYLRPFLLFWNEEASDSWMLQFPGHHRTSTIWGTISTNYNPNNKMEQNSWEKDEIFWESSLMPDWFLIEPSGIHTSQERVFQNKSFGPGLLSSKERNLS